MLLASLLTSRWSLARSYAVGPYLRLQHPRLPCLQNQSRAIKKDITNMMMPIANITIEPQSNELFEADFLTNIEVSKVVLYRAFCSKVILEAESLMAVTLNKP